MKYDDYKMLINNLPENPGILGRKKKYKNYVVFIPFIEIDNEYHLLFQKRAAGIRQGGEICFPGGQFDKEHDTTFRDTAIRETVEELGIREELILVEGRFDTLFGAMGAIIEIYLGRINIGSLDECNINKNEVESIFTVPLSYFIANTPEVHQVRLTIEPSYRNEAGEEVVLLPAKELGLPKRYHKNWQGGLFDIYFYRTGQGIIWGITAEIIYELLEFARIKRSL